MEKYGGDSNILFIVVIVYVPYKASKFYKGSIYEQQVRAYVVTDDSPVCACKLLMRYLKEQIFKWKEECNQNIVVMGD